jgi:hypothetical protein
MLPSSDVETPISNFRKYPELCAKFPALANLAREQLQYLDSLADSDFETMTAGNAEMIKPLMLLTIAAAEEAGEIGSGYDDYWDTYKTYPSTPEIEQGRYLAQWMEDESHRLMSQYDGFKDFAEQLTRDVRALPGVGAPPKPLLKGKLVQRKPPTVALSGRSRQGFSKDFLEQEITPTLR